MVIGGEKILKVGYARRSESAPEAPVFFVATLTPLTLWMQPLKSPNKSMRGFEKYCNDCLNAIRTSSNP